jgi:hypothetical protein
MRAKQNIAEKPKYGNVSAWDKASGVKISKVTGSAWSPRRRLAEEGALKIFISLKPRKPLKRLISDERIQGNPSKNNRPGSPFRSRGAARR